MEEKENFLDSFIDTLKERLTSPFYGTFVLSWILWNWRIFYVTLFLKNKEVASGKIFYIADQLGNYCKSLLLPAISTYVIVKLLPLLTSKFYKWSLESSKEFRNIKVLIDGSKLLTVEEQTKMKADFADRIKVMREENSDLEIERNKHRDRAESFLDRLTLKEDTDKSGKILLAYYGFPPYNKDVKSELYQAIFQQHMEIHVTKENFGDPYEGHEKTLKIIYKKYGGEYEFLELEEGKKISIDLGLKIV